MSVTEMALCNETNVDKFQYTANRGGKYFWWQNEVVREKLGSISGESPSFSYTWTMVALWLDYLSIAEP